MIANPDIIAEAGKRKGNRILVGFALETDNEHKNAKEKLQKKNLDMIVLNNPTEEGAAFATETNRVTIIKKQGKPLELPLQTKRQVAEVVIDHIVKLVQKSDKSGHK